MFVDTLSIHEETENGGRVVRFDPSEDRTTPVAGLEELVVDGSGAHDFVLGRGMGPVQTVFLGLGDESLHVVVDDTAHSEPRGFVVDRDVHWKGGHYVVARLSGGRFLMQARRTLLTIDADGTNARRIFPLTPNALATNDQ